MCKLLIVFDRSIDEMKSIADCDILNKIRGQVVLADKYISMHADDEVSLKYNKELIKIMKNKYWTTDPDKINYFVQRFGEFIFYIICKKKELLIYRLKEQDTPTADFKIKYNNEDVYFEVKTPTYVCSDAHIKRDLENSLNNNIILENKIKNGGKYAFVERCISPYYDSNKFNDKKLINLIVTLIDKAKTNLKKAQFEGNKTFLVYNLSILEITEITPSVLCPVYQDNDQINCLRSGELWSLGFISEGTPIHNIPEFEGTVAIEDLINNKCGLLIDDDYKYVKGMILMLYDGVFNDNNETQLYGLSRYEDNFSSDESIKLFHFLVGDNWNDEKNTNGWRLLPKHGKDSNG